MRYSFSLAPYLLLALTLVLCLTEQQQTCTTYAASLVRASRIVDGTARRAPTRRARSRARARAEAKPVVREVNLEALQKLLQRATGRDARPILVNFWATWCEPCRDEFPDLVRIKADYEKRNLDFITVSLDDPAEIKTSVPD